MLVDDEYLLSAVSLHLLQAILMQDDEDTFWHSSIRLFYTGIKKRKIGFKNIRNSYQYEIIETAQ